MKQTLTLATLALVLMFASFAQAQTIKPRRANAAPAATTPAPATTPEPAKTDDPKAAAPATEETDPPTTLDDVYSIAADARAAAASAKTAAQAAETAANRRHYGDGTSGIFTPALIGLRGERLHQKVNWLVRGMVVLVLLNLFLMGVIVLKPLRRRFLGTLVALFALGLAASANAQPPAPKAAPACTVRSITTGSVVVKEQDPAPITFALKNCGEVKEVKAGDVTFTDVVTKGNLVTAKVAAPASAPTGPMGFSVVDDKGATTDSPDAVYLLVLDTATAQVRKDTLAANTRTNRSVAALKAETTKSVSELKAKLDAVAASQLTTAQVEAIVAPLKAKVADLEKVTGELLENEAVVDGRLNVLAQATAGLAEGQARLGNTVVKKGGILGFGGKKPLDPEVAAAAARIKAALAK